jgi:hypothetical protein
MRQAPNQEHECSPFVSGHLPSPEYSISPLPELALTGLPPYDVDNSPHRNSSSRQSSPDAHQSYSQREEPQHPDPSEMTPEYPMHFSSKPTSSPMRSRNEQYSIEPSTRNGSAEHYDETHPPQTQPIRNGQISHASIAAQKYTKREKRRSSESGERAEEARNQDWAVGSAQSNSSVEQAIMSQSPLKRASLSRHHSYSVGVLQPSAPISSLEQGSMSRNSSSVPVPTAKSRAHRSSPKLKESW